MIGKKIIADLADQLAQSSTGFILYWRTTQNMAAPFERQP